jgi:hydroxyacylglutathione hydrolase
MTLAGPRGENEQDAGAAIRGDRAPLVRVEGEEAAGPTLDRLVSGLHANGAVQHRDERPFLDLVLPERLARIEGDQHCARRVIGAKDDGRSAPAGRFDLPQVPALHSAILTGWAERAGADPSLDSSPVSLTVDRYELGPISTNCYLVRATPDAPEGVVIDPSGESAELQPKLTQTGARCSAILITHGHWDHLVGVGDLAEATGAPVYMAEDERMLLEDVNSFTPFTIELRSHTPEALLKGDETLELAGITFETLRVPGHSPAHLAYHADGCLFSGDVLFAGSVGRTDLPGADWDTLLQTLRMLTERFPPETTVYAGHGPPTTLGAELDRNPFLAELRA